MKNKVKSDAAKAAIRKGIITTTVVVVVAAIIGIGVWAIGHFSKSDEEDRVVLAKKYEGPDKDYVLENDNLVLTVSSDTSQFSVYNKNTGKTWYSNPQDREDDNIALPVDRDKLGATLLLTYSTKNGVDTLFDNYTYSMKNQMYDIEQGDDYIKVMYSIGIVEKEFVIPPAITAENMDKLLAVLEKKEATKILDYYKDYDINNLGKKDNKDELLERYPILGTEPIYALRDTTKDNMKGKLEEYFEKAGYTTEDWERDKLLDTSVSVSAKPVFNISIIYRLEGNDLVAELPFEEMEYKESYPIYNIAVLPYFGAAGIEDTGFMVVPEGGGAIIDFNNGKVTQNYYYANLYGWDMAQERKAVVHDTDVYFNTFGMSKNEDSFICILEDGVSYGAIQADISGKTNSYNSVYAVYNVLHRNQYDVSDRTTTAMFVYEDSLPAESIVQRYRFIDEDDYVSMAKEYGEYLTDKYAGYLTENDDTQAPVNIEILGAVDKIKQVFGVPVSKPLKLTTYNEALDIISGLYEKGMTNMSVKLTGWMNGGVRQNVLKHVKPVSELGSKKDLKKLISSTAGLGIDFYLNGVTNYEYDSNIFDGFIEFRDSAKYISKKRTALYEYSTISYGQEKWKEGYHLLKASLIWDNADTLAKVAGKYGAGVSFEDYGCDLSSDFNKNELVTRQESLIKQAGQLKGYKDSGKQVMINRGNDYAIAYADIVMNMELMGSNYSIIDRFIPFYQIAVHGLVNYTGESLNLAQDYTDELLKSAEYGAGLSFTFMDESLFALQSTYYTKYFGADYSAWGDKAVEIYTRYNNELGNVFNQRIVNHSFESDTLTCTTYEDGTKVYVNYGYKDDKTSDNHTVPARDYLVVK